MAPNAARVLVVGLGNRLRGDDASGLEAARLVGKRATDVIVVEHEREPTDLIELWQGARLAIVLDALEGDDPGRVHRFEAGRDTLPAHRSTSASTHALELAEVIELARSLGRLPDRLVVLGIEGERFETGAGLSDQVERAVHKAAELALAELGRAGAGL
jgi:hydrogenase maturation protease